MSKVQRGWVRATVLAALGMLYAGVWAAVAGPEPAVPPPDALAVFFSGELVGSLTPCGCTNPMLGGLPRRGRYLKSLGALPASVRVESGDLTEAMGRQDEMKAETVVEMLNALQYDAIALGERDFRQGVPFLQALQTRFKGALLCANARQAADGAPIFKEFAVVRRQVGVFAGAAPANRRPVRVAIAGALSEQYAGALQVLNPDVRIEAPADALARLRPALAGQSDVRILLYHGPKAEAEEIARSLPVFQLVLFAHDADRPAEGERAGASLLACGGQDGKYLGWAALGPGAGWRVNQVDSVAMVEELGEDDEIARIQKAYLERVAAEDLLGRVPRAPTANGDTYAGTPACAACHKEADRVWHAGKHARALQTLVEKGHDKDPECVVCHVVGLDREGGFAGPQKTPGLEGVGCESCHGPCAKHARTPGKLPKAGQASCAQCHVPRHSPDFEFDKYWEKVKHGKD